MRGFQATIGVSGERYFQLMIWWGGVVDNWAGLSVTRSCKTQRGLDVSVFAVDGGTINIVARLH